MIDGGDDSQRLFAELGEVMPFWDREIDYAIVTHPDWDHVGGQTDLPERFRIGRAIISENTRGHEDSQSWLAALNEAGVHVEGLQQGGWLDLGDGVALWALWPPPEEELHDFEEHDKNERSLILKLVYGEFTVLLTGDAGQPSEERMLRGGRPIAAHVLKVGHHGSEHSSGRGFIEAVGPSVAVIQVGAENRYGHPDPEVLETLDGRLVLRNDLEGRIHVWSDGKLMWIETESGAVTDLFEQSGAASTVRTDWGMKKGREHRLWPSDSAAAPTHSAAGQASWVHVRKGEIEKREPEYDDQAKGRLKAIPNFRLPHQEPFSAD